MDYLLMRKNESITNLFISENGIMQGYSKKFKNKELAPLMYRKEDDWIERWWNNRPIPIAQGKIAKMLKDKNLYDSKLFLTNNLGLSLNDYYWIKPVDSKLSWEDVNLFDNDFKENLLIKIDDNCGYSSGSFKSFTPNSSLQGQLEKSWQIRKGKRILIKGNPDVLSSDSMNEVFASMLHKAQGYDNYADYKLIEIKNKPYKYGCYSECFTDQKRELVSAWAILTSEKKDSGKSDYEQLIAISEQHGIDAKQFRKDLEYQIMTDYILSNRDRHMENISVLRDADSLKFKRMAPIYDTGCSMFVRKRFPIANQNIINQDTNSFEDNEQRLLKLVTDRSLVDTAKLPSADELYKLYKKDPVISEYEIEQTCKCYETKVKAFEQWQNG